MKLSELRSLMRNVTRLESEGDYRLVQAAVEQIGLDPNNFYQELEMESRYVDTHRDISWTNSRVSLHSHTFYEVLYCRSTCDVEYLVGADRYRLQRGDIIVVPPGVSHRPLLPEKMTEPYKRYVLWISPEFIHESAKLITGSKVVPTGYTTLLRTAGTPWEFLEDYFRTGVRESENRRPGWEAMVLGNTMVLLIQLSRAIEDSKVKPLLVEKPELLDLVMGYMEANLPRRLTLGDVARQFYVSESTISQLFRKKMNVSFHRCLTQRRLIAAKSLIEKDVPLELVSEQVGFQDYSAFYRAFKQEYGISPRQYRKRQQDMAVE